MSASRPAVLYVVDEFDRRGGTEVHVMESHRLLREAGYRVVVAAGSEPVEASPGDLIHVVPGLALGRLTARVRRALGKIRDEVEPDIIHAHSPPLNDSDALLGLAQRQALVWSIHSLIGCAGHYKAFPNGRPCHRAHGPLCLSHMVISNCGHRRIPFPNVMSYRTQSVLTNGVRRADACVVYSQYMARHHAANGIANTVVAPLFLSVPPPPSYRYPADGRVLFAGRTTPQKGLPFLIKAIARTGLTLDVAGDGWGRPAAERLAAKLGVSDRVNFLGWLSSAELERAYARAAVVAVPSMLPEPFGLTGIEALARGRAVVATNWGGIPEWCRHEVTGLLVKPNDVEGFAAALSRVAEHPDEASAMGRSGREFVEARHSPTQYLEAIDRIYEGARRVAKARWEGFRDS